MNKQAWKLILKTSFFFLMLGPLIGGAPFNLMLAFLIVSYLSGALPAVIAGLLFGLCMLRLTEERYGQAIIRSGIGALTGAIGGCLGSMIERCLMVIYENPMFFNTESALWISPLHVISGTFAGAICGALFRAHWIKNTLNT